MTGTAASAAGWNRLVGLHRAVALLLLALLATLIVLGTAERHAPRDLDMRSPLLAKEAGMIGDHALYLKVLRKMEAGAPYYQTVAEEHRIYGYPLRPFVAVRLPTLEVALSKIGLPAGTVIASILGLVALVLWRRRLVGEPGLPAYARFGVLLMAINLGQVMSGQWVLIHEVIAGVLIAIALALYRPEKPWAAMAAVTLALTIRETVLPVAMLFGLVALIDRNWKVAAAWVGIGAVFAGGLALHAAAVAEVVRPDDIGGAGWLGMNGWNNYIGFIHNTSALRFGAPQWVAAILTPLALLGWLAWRSRLGTLGLAVQLGYAAAFMLFARPDNDYWGMLVVPTLFIGLVFAPAALAALIDALRRPASLEPAPRSA